MDNPSLLELAELLVPAIKKLEAEKAELVDLLGNAIFGGQRQHLGDIDRWIDRRDDALAKHKDANEIGQLKAERDRQYEENVSLITKNAQLEAENAELIELLETIPSFGSHTTNVDAKAVRAWGLKVRAAISKHKGPAS